MGTSYRKCTDRLAQCFAAINESVEAQILDQMIGGGDSFCAFRFELNLETLAGMCRVLSRNSQLWADFQGAVQAHRTETDWTTMVEHVFTVGNLEGKLRLLEQWLRCSSAEDRRQLAGHLNFIDAEIALCRELADRRNLAARINDETDFPLVDGLTLRGVTYILGEHRDLWREFQSLVEQAAIEPRNHPPLRIA
jgi:hypothetical protein